MRSNTADGVPIRAEIVRLLGAGIPGPQFQIAAWLGRRRLHRQRPEPGRLAQGERDSFDGVAIAGEGAKAALVGKLGDKFVKAGVKFDVRGVTTGRNSFAAVARASFSKLKNGTASHVSLKTAGKGIVAATVRGTGGALSDAYSQSGDNAERRGTRVQ